MLKRILDVLDLPVRRRLAQAARLPTDGADDLVGHVDLSLVVRTLTHIEWRTAMLRLGSNQRSRVEDSRMVS